MKAAAQYPPLKTLMLALPVALLIVFTRPWRLTDYNSFAGAVLSFPFYEDTFYSEGYSESGWRKVKVGMTESEVHALIGTPLTDPPHFPKIDPLKYSARWSHSPGGHSYWCRNLHFENHRVVRKHEEFYVD